MPYAAFHPDCHAITKPTLADLRKLAGEIASSGLMLMNYDLDSLEPLAVFRDLEILKIMTSGRITTLHGLASHSKLRYLVIAPPPSWDGSSRRIEVDSYRPIASLRSLERLSLLRVRPRDLDLAPIAAMRHLRDLHIAGVPEFTLEHYARLAAALPETEGHCLQPFVKIEGIGFCKPCGGRMVLLTGAPPRARNWLCPKCNEKKLAAHVARWEEIKKAAQ